MWKTDYTEDLQDYRQSISAAAAYLQTIAPAPDFFLVLGSGWSAFVNELTDRRDIDMSSIPNYPIPGAPGHKCVLSLGNIAGVSLVVAGGRKHAYEGSSPWEIAFPLRVMHAWGVRKLILTNAAGSVNPAFAPPSLMNIVDHISLRAESGLKGANLEEFGPRFPDQSEVYDKASAEILRTCAAEAGITLHEGVYYYTTGPAFETPAEVRMITRFGADAVGMSTVAEAQVASHQGMRILAISCLTNWGTGMTDEKNDSDEVLDAGKQILADFTDLMRRSLPQLQALI